MRPSAYKQSYESTGVEASRLAEREGRPRATEGVRERQPYLEENVRHQRARVELGPRHGGSFLRCSPLERHNACCADRSIDREAPLTGFFRFLFFFFSIEATDRQEEQGIGERVGETGRDGTGRGKRRRRRPRCSGDRGGPPWTVKPGLLEGREGPWHARPAIHRERTNHGPQGQVQKELGPRPPPLGPRVMSRGAPSRGLVPALHCFTTTVHGREVSRAASPEVL